nr:SMC family ATPase [Frondihabitans sucicola]
MDLHRLTLRAVGPYAAEYSIDFAALGASGVFLLEGPTGSGKSTIIDAIVFALYGGLAGSSSSDDRLHSHHAAPTVEPYVELVFETTSGVHRIRRTPAWDRPKTRGTGTTRVNQAVTLVRLASPDATDGEPLSSRAQEVGVEIRRIIGLTKEQFLQTIVLPQGSSRASSAPAVKTDGWCCSRCSAPRSTTARPTNWWPGVARPTRPSRRPRWPSPRRSPGSAGPRATTNSRPPRPATPSSRSVPPLSPRPRSAMRRGPHETPQKSRGRPR